MDIILTFEGIAFICCWWLLHPRNDVRVRTLIVVMLITMIVEAIGYYYKNVLGTPNHQFYNVSVPLLIFLFGVLLYKHYGDQGLKRLLMAGLVLFMAFALANAVFGQGPERFCTYTYIAGALLLVVGTIFYFLEVIQRPVHVSLQKEPMFWIGSAIIVLYLPKCILYSVFEYLAYRNEALVSFGATFHLINKVLSVIFFTCLSYASICRLIYRN